jgi:hypothetical protein
VDHKPGPVNAEIAAAERESFHQLRELARAGNVNCSPLLQHQAAMTT